MVLRAYGEPLPYTAKPPDVPQEWITEASAWLRPVEAERLTAIVDRSARILDVPIEDAAARAIASRGRGTPRIVNASTTCLPIRRAGFSAAPGFW